MTENLHGVPAQVAKKYNLVYFGHGATRRSCQLLHPLDEREIHSAHAPTSICGTVGDWHFTWDVRDLGKGQPTCSRCLEYLARYGVTRVLVEGGGETHAGFLEQGLADRIVFYIAPRLIGGREALSVVGGLGPASMMDARSLKRFHSFRVGDEIVVEGEL